MSPQPDVLTQVDCEEKLIGRCSPNIYHFSAPRILPLKYLYFEAEMSKTVNTVMLVHMKVSVIDAKITLAHETVAQQLQTLTVTTKIDGHPKDSNIKLLVSVGCSIALALVILTTVAFGFRKVNPPISLDETGRKDQGRGISIVNPC
ncbi:hypothetical protein RF11_12319 [Thelohanellus kitauei]|uniref:Uncharacterized protein n=1 Tax=Thelohanellus kitauei TaxID=669202 RepID=A0A0C2IQQ3_THEKT|nr:hypothetical protein RF11_12319 [Thelohanellus kitauei]